ncbi:MAG TPA: site-specific integrase [Gammaproteobacteria bacterium]|nr:site-specific integrase [Gammaproteobacteria bacterium]
MASIKQRRIWVIPAEPKPIRCFSEQAARKKAELVRVHFSRVKVKTLSWQVQIRRRGYPPVTRSFKKKAVAERFARETEAAMDAGKWIDMSLAEITTVADLLEQYAESENLDAKALSRVKLLTKYLGHYPLARLKTHHCMQFIRKRRGKPAERLEKYERWIRRQVARELLDPEDAEEMLDEAKNGAFEVPPLVQDPTIHRDLDELGMAIRWAREHRGLEIAINPLPSAKKKLVVKNERSRRPSEEDLAAIYAYSDENSPELRVIVEVAIETAMRRSELANLRIHDINWEAGEIRVTRQKSDTTSGGRKLGREVPMTRRAEEVLRAYVGDRKRGRVFSLRPDSITQAFSRACIAGKIEDLTFHDLRHHAISKFFEETSMSVTEVLLISGHASVRSLERYTDIRIQSVKEKLRAAGK